MCTILAQEKRLKERFEDIPTLDELHALELEGFGADVILVDSKKDKKLTMLKQLIVTLVKGLNASLAAMIKKIAGLVGDYYPPPPPPTKAPTPNPNMHITCSWSPYLFALVLDKLINGIRMTFSPYKKKR